MADKRRSSGTNRRMPRSSEAGARELIENANSIILRMDAEGNILYLNDFACRFFDYPESELLGRNIVGTIVPETSTDGLNLLKEMKEGLLRYPERYVTNRNENMRRGGERVWIAWTNRAIFDKAGRLVEILSIGNDISDKKRMEDELRESEASLANAQQMVHVGSWTWDAKTNTIRLSDEQFRILGWEPRGFHATLPNIIGFLHPDDRNKAIGAVEESIKNHTPVDLEFRIIRKDGQERTIRGIGHIEYDDGELRRIYGMTQDITERKMTEEALLTAKNEAELYVDLMGHDINNMNQITMGYLELALDIVYREGALGTGQAGLLEKAAESLKASSGLIDSVRKLQRQKAGFYRMGPQRIDRVLCSVIARFQNVPGRSVTINYALQEAYRVNANELLEDVFLNLVGNSIKHSRGTLTVNIIASMESPGGRNFCTVVVEDDGPGIPDDLKKSLFDRLNLVTTKARGKGFGLCLTKMLVEDYGGHFWVEDRVPGDYTRGTRFVVMLPIAE